MGVNEWMRVESYEGAEIGGGSGVVLKMNEKDGRVRICVEDGGMVSEGKGERKREDVKVVG